MVVGWVGGGVCKVISVSNPTSVLRLCCVVVVVVTISSFVKIWLIFPKISCDLKHFLLTKFVGLLGKEQPGLNI